MSFNTTRLPFGVFFALCALMMTTVLAPADPQRPAGIPADAVYFNGKWYRVYLEGSSWKSSHAKCERNGGQLVVIKDRTTQDFVAKLANGRKLFVGASADRNGVWNWVDGTPVTYKGWDRGQPNNLEGRERCAAIGPKGTWYDVPDNSDWTQGYVCEWVAK